LQRDRSERAERLGCPSDKEAVNGRQPRSSD
jgi:hypothetical protein